MPLPVSCYVGLIKPLLETVHSDIAEIRGIYDDIYRWISAPIINLEI